MATSDDYQIWLTYNGEKEKLQIPVNPETISTSDGTDHDSVNIMGLGEILILQDRPAVEISWSSFFPATRFQGVRVTSLSSPLTYIQKLKAWKDSKQPVHLIITSCGIDLYCAITKLNYSESGGDIGTINYDIALKEYREITLRQVTVEDDTATVQNTEQRVDNTVTPSTYTVVSGDCLWNISLKYLGDGSKWMTIYEANKTTIDAHHGGPSMIWPGDVLTIPTS